MTYELTLDDKVSIIQQHLRNLSMMEYNNSISLLELNSVSVPNEQAIADLNVQISNIDAQKTALLSELNILQQQITN